jgi:hypothetical protein
MECFQQAPTSLSTGLPTHSKRCLARTRDGPPPSLGRSPRPADRRGLRRWKRRNPAAPDAIPQNLILRIYGSLRADMRLK